MKTKKADITFVFISMIVTVVTFIGLLTYATSTTENTITEFEELACKGYVNAKSTNIAKMADFFYQVNLNCRTDNIEITNDESKKEMHEILADRTVSCWERYGKGEEDFMSNINTQGQWCFACSKVELDDDAVGSLVYNDFIRYMENTDYPNDKDNLKYIDRTNIVYVDYQSGEVTEIREQLKESKEKLKDLDIPDIGLPELIFKLEQTELELIDISNKNFAPGEELYVVYKYDRIDESNLKDISQFAIGAGAGAVGGTITGAAVSALLTGGVSLVVSAVKFVNKAKNIAEAAAAMREAWNALDKLGKLKKFSITSARLGATPGGVGGIAGGYVGANINLNNIQYVDVLSKEEYYRKCGTIPSFEK